MQTIKHSLSVIIAFCIAGCATMGDGSKWVCTTDNIQNYHYNGSDVAMIHVRGDPHGHSYKITKSTDGNSVTGVTRFGAPFTCSKIELKR
jgi:hypothetical protein